MTREGREWSGGQLICLCSLRDTHAPAATPPRAPSLPDSIRGVVCSDPDVLVNMEQVNAFHDIVLK